MLEHMQHTCMHMQYAYIHFFIIYKFTQFLITCCLHNLGLSAQCISTAAVE